MSGLQVHFGTFLEPLIFYSSQLAGPIYSRIFIADSQSIYKDNERRRTARNTDSSYPFNGMLSRRWARVFYISTYYAIIVGIGLSLLVTGYDLIQQTIALATGGGRYFYIFILVGAYVATVCSNMSELMKRVYSLELSR